MGFVYMNELKSGAVSCVPHVSMKTSLGGAPDLVNGNKLGITRLPIASKAEQIEMNHNGRRTLRHTTIRGN